MSYALSALNSIDRSKAGALYPQEIGEILAKEHKTTSTNMRVNQFEYSIEALSEFCVDAAATQQNGPEKLARFYKDLGFLKGNDSPKNSNEIPNLVMKNWYGKKETKDRVSEFKAALIDLTARFRSSHTLRKWKGVGPFSDSAF